MENSLEITEQNNFATEQQLVHEAFHLFIEREPSKAELDDWMAWIPTTGLSIVDFYRLALHFRYSVRQQQESQELIHQAGGDKICVSKESLLQRGAENFCMTFTGSAGSTAGTAVITGLVALAGWAFMAAFQGSRGK